jgi:GDP/UDP-N,N'-diacetylbacillosamine 2-epimerase (hydrolysing)
MEAKRKVLAITGIRSEYDILYPVIKVLSDDERLELKLVVSGAHLSDWHGYTIKKIEDDGFEIADRIDSLFSTNRKSQRAKGIGALLAGLSQTVEREQPDFLIYVGDREEGIAAALVGNYMDILFVHIGGGDPVYGNADDPIRFAISKLAHIHFAFTKQYADNLLSIGEEEFRVFFAGNPALDNIRNTHCLHIEDISNYLHFDINENKYIVLIKHPLSSEKEDAYIQMKTTLVAVEEFCKETSIKAVGIYPNTDPGSFDILNAIKESEGSEYVKFYKNLPREIFINLLRKSLALVGNSSMGVLEAPFYKLPVVNIGNRQKGRLNAGNVEFVEYNNEKIKEALSKACFDARYRGRVRGLESPYGDGGASGKIKDILLSINRSDKKWYVKKRLC